MKQNKKKKAKVELKYESVDRVSRWNLCQLLCSLIFKSDMTQQEIEHLISNFEEVIN